MKRFIISVFAFCAVAFLSSESFSQLGGLDAVGLLNKQLQKYTINFKFNESSFTDPDYIKKMDEYAPLIKEVTVKIPSGYALVVCGHASKEGTEQYNQYLSAERARTVYKRLIEAGVAAAVMKTEGQGTALDRRVVTFEIRKK